MSKNVVIIYGRGHDWNFKVFADSLKYKIRNSDSSAKITLKEIIDVNKFYTYLKSWPLSKPIDELHIFSHAIGAGLYLGYGDPTVGSSRNRMLTMATARKSQLTYDEVRRTESGGVLTDNLHYTPLSNNKAALQKIFSATGSIKLWGCNSAISGWQYSDPDTNGRPIYDPKDKTASYFYWRALNTQHSPKPSIAEALAKYFNVKVYGASSGSHIEVYHKSIWITSEVYKAQFGSYPPGTMPHRLHPDKGVYLEFKP